MTGTSGTDSIYAKEGNDILRGRGALDDLRGGLGNDDLNGGRGNDQYNFYENNWGNDFISGDRSGAEDWLIFQISSGALTIGLKPSSIRDEVSSGANTINVEDGDSNDIVCTGPGKDKVTKDSGDIVDDPALCT